MGILASWPLAEARTCQFEASTYCYSDDLGPNGWDATATRLTSRVFASVGEFDDRAWHVVLQTLTTLVGEAGVRGGSGESDASHCCN